MKYSISAIIPNFNGKNLLEKNIPSLFIELERCGADFEVIVVDDCSTDDSVVFMKTTYPNIILVEQPKNQGFSASCNAGIRVATKELVFLMNSDIILTENYFAPQFRYFDHEDTFGVMGKIIGYFDDKVQDTAKYPKLKGFKLKACNNYEIENLSPNFMTPSFYLSGANALILRDKLLQIGAFDEIYSPFYSEDLDLSIRAWRMGWICYYEPLAVCRHEGSVTTNALKKDWVYTTYQRNRYIFHSIHLDGFTRFMYNAQITADLLVRWVSFKFGVYKGYWRYIKMSKQIKESREKFAREMQKEGSTLTISQIIDKMLSMLEGKTIKRV